jgi:hypothetical protein
VQLAHANWQKYQWGPIHSEGASRLGMRLQLAPLHPKFTKEYEMLIMEKAQRNEKRTEAIRKSDEHDLNPQTA